MAKAHGRYGRARIATCGTDEKGTSDCMAYAMTKDSLRSREAVSIASITCANASASPVAEFAAARPAPMEEAWLLWSTVVTIRLSTDAIEPCTDWAAANIELAWSFAAWGEGWLDYIDSVHRTNASRRITDDLVNRRIAHGRDTALEMRKLVGRIKGGWLAKAIRKSRK